jgi:heme exporter protein B
MIHVAALVARKDLRIELRSRVLAWQVLPFGVMALLLCGLALGPNAAGRSHAGPGLFYIVVTLMALLMINRSQAIESSRGTKDSVATLGLDPAGVFLGKAAALTVEMWLASAVLLTGTVLFLHVDQARTLVAIPSIAASVAALSLAGTLYGALTSSQNSSLTLLPVLALPAFAPLLIAGERAYSAVVYGGELKVWWSLLVISLIAYSSVGVLLYGVIGEL